MRFIARYPIAALIVICLLSRIPLLLSPYFFLDGDECIIGLMAKHLYEGKELFLFFWGQNYGLAIVEIIAILPFYLLLGYTTLAVKLGIFSVWIVGVVFLYKTLIAVTNNNAASFTVTVFFVLFPAWGNWCMKASGGYVAAFMLSNLLLYLLFSKHFKKGTGFFLIAGLLLELVFESQRLWLIGLLPLTIYALRKEVSLIKGALLLLSAVLTWILLYKYKEHMQIMHTAPLTLPDVNEVLWYITRFPEYLYHSFCGDYYFNQFPNHDLFITIMSAIGCVLFFAFFLIGIYCLFKSNKNYLFLISLVFIPATIGYNFLSYMMEGRYLIPVAGFLCIPLVLLIKEQVRHRLFKPVFILSSIIGLGACINFYNFCEGPRAYKKSVLQTIDYLNRNDVRYTYSTDCMMSYQIIFYSGEKIFSRMTGQPARYQAYSDAVDSAFDNHAKVAILQYGNFDQGMHFTFDKKTPIISICIDPPIYEMWKAIEFRHARFK